MIVWIKKLIFNKKEGVRGKIRKNCLLENLIYVILVSVNLKVSHISFENCTTPN